MNKQSITVKEIFSIPNIMSYIRLILIPVICWIYLHATSQSDYYIATAILLFSSLTDMLDGWVARKFNMITNLGKILDPVADKLTHGALAICLAVKHPLMWVLLTFMVIKEGFMAIKGYQFLQKGIMLDGAHWCGKVTTALLFVGLFVLFLFPTIPAVIANIMILIMMLSMGYTFFYYASLYRKLEQGEKKNGVIKL